MQARRFERLTLQVAALGALPLLLPCNPAAAESPLHHGVVWYSNARDDALRQRAAGRYEVGITGKNDGQDADRVAMKALDPSFQWYVYNSGTDNYVTSPSGTPEHDLLVSLANARGWDVEEAYMHFWDDTRMVLEGDTVLVRGWGGGSAATAAEARIPVYYRNLSRRVVHFATPRAAQLHREAMVQLAFGMPFSGSSVYADGLFLDNSTARLFNFGTILDGGHVRETPEHLLLGSWEYQDWHWESNFGPFLTTLKDTLEAAAGWAADGRRKYLMINVANIWDDGYVSRDAADVLFMEFQYNAVRNFGTWMVDEAYRRDTLASTSGIACFYAATMTRSVSGRVGEYSLAETMLGNLVFYLMTRTPGTIFYEMGTSTPSTAGWDSLTWRGCIDVANAELGEALGGPYTLASGVDPLGNAYVVKAREYQRGLVVLRNRGDWDEGIEVASAVTVPLPRLLMPVTPAGATANPVQVLSLRNGQGALLLDHALAVDLQSFTVERQPGGGAELRWVVASASADHLGFHVHRGDAAGPQLQLTTTLLRGGREYRFVDASAPAGGAHYWLAEWSDAGVTWHGPVVLPALAAWGAYLELAEPNPFQVTTSIRFGLERGGRAVLRVYDVRGREVRRLFDGDGDGRSYVVSWDGKDAAGRRVAPGVYFYRLQTQRQSFTRKLHLAP
jgi:hypothetical protein